MKAVKRFRSTSTSALVSFPRSNWHSPPEIPRVTVTRADTTGAGGWSRSPPPSAAQAVLHLRRLKTICASLSAEETRRRRGDLGVRRGPTVTEMEKRLAAPRPCRSIRRRTPTTRKPTSARRIGPPRMPIRREVEYAGNAPTISTDRLHGALSASDERKPRHRAAGWDVGRQATLHQLADKYGVSAERDPPDPESSAARQAFAACWPPEPAGRASPALRNVTTGSASYGVSHPKPR